MPAPPAESLYWVGLCSNSEGLAWFGLAVLLLAGWSRLLG